jgi:AraC family transcriptional regulator
MECESAGSERDLLDAEAGVHYEAEVHSTSSVLERVEVTRPQRIRNHHHPRPHLVLVLSGRMIERRGSRTMSLEPGTIRITGEATHDLEFVEPGFRCIVLEGSCRWFESEGDAFQLVQERTDLIGQVLRLQRHLAGRPGDAALLDLDAAELFAQFLRGKRRVPGGVPAWLTHIHEWVAASTLLPGVDAMAAEASVHPSHLLRTFQEYFGMSIGEFHRRLRVTRAARAITDSDEPFAKLAARLGYCDQSHLNRALRKYLGTTPQRLRSERGGATTRAGDDESLG